jgi:hypothetical protein
MRTRLAAVVAIVVLSSLGLPTPSMASTWCGSLADLFPDGVTTLRGDLDADHRGDVVSTTARWTGDQTCRARLTVVTASRRFTRRIDPLFGSLLAPPPLAGLIHVGPGPRLDVAVIVMVGASTGFVDVYGLRGGALVRVSPETFAYAGSVVNRAGVDCIGERGARIVSSAATFERDNRYHVQRHFYARRAGILRSLPRRDEEATVRFNQLDRYPEFAAQVPFPSCTAVSGSA